MSEDCIIPPPLLFNPLKHHLAYIKEFIESVSGKTGKPDKDMVLRELRQLGGSVMDVYSGELTCRDVCNEMSCFLRTRNIESGKSLMAWIGTNSKDFRNIYLSDGSQWVLKRSDNEIHYVHIFPARFSPHSFRIKANTLKSAILYQVFIGKDFISEDDLNISRAIGSLSPVKDIFDAAAISEMVELLRS